MILSIVAQIGNSPLFYMAGGVLIGIMIHQFYVYQFYKEDQILELLDSNIKEYACHWILENLKYWKELEFLLNQYIALSESKKMEEKEDLSRYHE